MTNLLATPAPAIKTMSRRPTGVRGAVVAVGVASLALSACGGGSGDDEADATTTTQAQQVVATTAAPAATTTAAPTTTTSPTPTEVQYVTEGAAVVVANASRVDGAAGRLSERLELVGYETDTPQDSSEGPLEVSKVYYNASVDGAQAVADSVRLALGGGAITVAELPTPPPVESGSLGDGSVLVAMGNDIADRTLQDLQGLTEDAAEDAADTDAGDTEDTTTTEG